MAQIGVKCVRGFIKHAECRTCSTDPLHPCMLPTDILELMRQKDTDYHADPDRFSPTGLLDCSRKSVLVHRGNWYVDVEQAWPMTRGTLAHAVMEANPSYPGAVGVIREQHMETEIETRYGPQRFVGTPDLVVVQSLQPGEGITVAKVAIVDYKTTGEIKHDLTQARPDHVRQINMYALLVSRWLADHYTEPLAVEITELSIVYLDFKKVRRFTSAGALVTRGKRVSRSPDTYAELELAPLHIFPQATVEAGIRRMIEAKLAARDTLPPAYDLDDENYWRCAYCPVRETCEDLTKRGI